MKISTGSPEDHPTPLPLNSEHSPGVQQPTVRDPGSTGPADAGIQVVGVYDGTAARLGQMGALEAECAAAQSAGMAAEGARRQHYAQDVLPQGASYGDALPLLTMPEDATAPDSDFPFAQGDQPGRGT